MMRPTPEFVPYNMMNANYNYNNNNLNPELGPPRHPPPPPPEMADMGLHSGPHPSHAVPIFPLDGPRFREQQSAGRRIFEEQPSAGRLFQEQVFRDGVTRRVMFMMSVPGPASPGRADFGLPVLPSLPLDLGPPSPHTPLRNEFELDFENSDTDFEEDREQIPVGTPVNFALCKERFNGIGDVRPFINAVIDFKYCSEMKDESALRSFSLLLTDQAATWWQANKAWVTDWDSAIKLLRDSYRPPMQQHRIYHSFFNAPQNEETTAAFVQRTKDLLSKIPVNTLTQETQLDLIFAMLHRRIKDNVNRDDCENLLDLMERARQVEESIAARATAPSQEPASGETSAPVEKQILIEDPELLQSLHPEPSSALSEALSEPDALVTAPSSPSLALPFSDLAESFEPSCDHCKTYGLLFERTCRKLLQDERSPQDIALLEKLSKLDAETFGKIICFRCRSDHIVDQTGQKCTHEIAAGSPLISVAIYEVDFNFAVDTGSSYSYASSKLIDHLIACGQEFVFNVLVMPIKGMPMRQVFRVANVEVIVAGIPISTVLVDIPGATKSVFGIDFIKQAGLMFDFRGEGTWTVRGGRGEQPVFYERSNRRLY